MSAFVTSRHVNLLLVALWSASTVFNAVRGNWPASIAALAATMAFAEIAHLRPEAELKPNQAIVTAQIEPSSDMRQAARAMTEIRTALIAAGYTPEQASRQVADMIAANGDQS